MLVVLTLWFSFEMHSPYFGQSNAQQTSSFGPPVSDANIHPQMVQYMAAQAAQHAARTGNPQAAQQAAAWAAQAAGQPQAMGPMGPTHWQGMPAPQPFVPSQIPGMTEAPTPPTTHAHLHAESAPRNHQCPWTVLVPTPIRSS